jgi:hypothetical protein
MTWTIGNSRKAAAAWPRQATRQPRAGQDDVIPPPSTVTVWDDRPVVLWTHDERPIVRKAGF